jgi:hypothetical protein
MKALFAAAGLAIALGLVHSYLGERYILIRLFRRSDLPQIFGSDTFTRRTLRFAWHLTTVAWFGVAALLLIAAGEGGPTVALARIGEVVAATCVASAVVTFAGSRGRHLAWIVFLVIAVLSWIGSH